ncbi:MAG: endonuclease [Prolixibacteraceae bacterium]|nr:endonuclease [Prolixibacteraceae bacterium]
MKIQTNKLIFVLLFIPLAAISQPQEKHFKFMFYNVENLFDTYDDPEKDDEEFLPSGERYWDYERYNRKLTRISQVIMAAGQGQLPAIIGLCEIENRFVLEQLLSQTPLGKMGYKIVHKESPDQRGIDVALLYMTEVFKPFFYYAIPVTKPTDTLFKTREILHVKGIIENDTLNVIVNHWPSKFGGVAETIPLRALAAKTLRNYSDSLLAINPDSKILIMGDFNDSPFDVSLSEILGAKPAEELQAKTGLYNLSYKKAQKGTGSSKYQGKWAMIDQMIVSGTLLTGKGLQVTGQGFQIFSPDFLLEKDKTYTGQKPFRTYTGLKYNDGFSDHLPVMLELGY